MLTLLTVAPAEVSLRSQMRVLAEAVEMVLVRKYT